MKNQKFKIKIQIIFGVLLLLPLSALAQNGNGEFLSDLIDEAKNNNPRIQESFNKWKAAEYKIKSVKSLEDPMASYGFFCRRGPN